MRQLICAIAKLVSFSHHPPRRSNWSTCYSDVAFVDALVESLQSGSYAAAPAGAAGAAGAAISAAAAAAAAAAAEGAPEGVVCADPDLLFLVGESNGAMLIHHLIASAPQKYRGAVPVFGLPMLGRALGPNFELLRDDSIRTSVLQLHDRSDTTIPWQGAASSDGWIYESLNFTLGAWAAAHGCNASTTVAIAGNETSGLDCYAFAGCENEPVSFCYCESCGEADR